MAMNHMLHEENQVWLEEVKGHVASAIRAYLERTGCSQRQLAKDLEVNPGQITKYLAGDNLPSLSGLKAMADLFQLPVGYFLDGDATASPHKSED